MFKSVLWHEVGVWEKANPNPTDEAQRTFLAHLSSLANLTWTFFNLVRRKFATPNDGLVESFQLLLCCCVTFRRLVGPEGTSTQQGVLDDICDVSGASKADVRKKLQEIVSPYLQGLLVNGLLKAPPGWDNVESLASRAEDGLSAIFDPTLPTFAANCTCIQNEIRYLREYTATEVDITKWAATIDFSSREKLHASLATGRGAGSALRSSLPGTPTSAASTASSSEDLVQWLVGLVGDGVPQLPEAIGRFIKTSSGEGGDSAAKHEAYKFASLTGAMGKVLWEASEPDCGIRDNEQRKRGVYLTTNLYYHLLSKLLVAEEARLHQRGSLGSLIRNHMFNKSLYGCCAEIVFFCMQLHKLYFPYILDGLDLQAFEFFKIVENVVRQEPSIPAEVRGHLVVMEEVILQEEAWAKGSELFRIIDHPSVRSMMVEKYIGAIDENPPGGKTQASEVTSSSQEISSQEKDGGNPESRPRPQSGTVHSLDLFLRKLFQLQWVRLHNLCATLVDAWCIRQMWNAFVVIVLKDTDVFENRHIDQILICIVYGIARVRSLTEVTFRAIVTQYRQSLSREKTSFMGRRACQKGIVAEVMARREDIFYKVYVNEQDGQVDIISFYNSTFVPRFDVTLLKFGNDGTDDGQEDSPSSKDAGKGLPRTPKMETPKKQNSRRRSVRTARKLQSESPHPGASSNPYSSPYLTPAPAKPVSSLPKSGILSPSLVSPLSCYTPARKKTPAANLTFAIQESPRSVLNDINNNLRGDVPVGLGRRKLDFSEASSATQERQGASAVQASSLQRKHLNLDGEQQAIAGADGLQMMAETAVTGESEERGVRGKRKADGEHADAPSGKERKRPRPRRSLN
eukprot:CAMPEP_0119140446 /NCGR_PEP_ID=MMETSP1310-20130426/29221_1 /TAXON_ID=464262 /ORGANISM="Genus nov. species nov., Strain RCC2339" /LENGTH=854 /DNA_ID=CAMNT_0007131801 /DNA_START=116 /DNA_END=2680 /DNA_ORIENTATION=-